MLLFVPGKTDASARLSLQPYLGFSMLEAETATSTVIFPYFWLIKSISKLPNFLCMALCNFPPEQTSVFGCEEILCISRLSGAFDNLTV